MGKDSSINGTQQLREDQFTFLHQDPLTFFVVQQISIGEVRSLKALKGIFNWDDTISSEIDTIVNRLSSLEILSLEGDRVVPLKHQYRFKIDPGVRSELLPRLFHIATKRAFADVNDSQSAPILFAISRNSETDAEVEAAIEDFRLKMREIGDRTKKRKVDGTRIVAIASAPMLVEDFASIYLSPESSSDRERIGELEEALHDLKPAVASLRALDYAASDCLPSELKDLLAAATRRIQETVVVATSRQERELQAVCVSTEVIACLESLQECLGQSTKVDLSELHRGTKATISSTDLRRILTNLILNAQEAATGQSITIKITLAESSRSAILNVENNGPPLNEEIPAKLRVGTFSSSKPGGSGIGLRSTAALLNRNGGRLVVTPGSVGRTVFQVVLPKVVS